MKTNILIIVLLILAGCSSSSNVASGSSTTVGNPMIIGVASVNGKPLVNAEIYLLDTNFIPSNPDTLKPILTDQNGRFVSDDRKAGICRISMIDSSGSVGSIGDFEITGDTVPVQLHGTTFGIVTTGNSEILMIPGTPFKSVGSIALPSGDIPSVVTIDSVGTVSTIGTDLQVIAGESISITRGFSWRELTTPLFASAPFVAETENGVLFMAADSQIFHRSDNGPWTKKIFSNMLITDVIMMDSSIWANTTNGIVKMDKSGSTLYTSANSPLSLPNSNAIARENGVFYALNGSKIYSFDGANWDSTALSRDSAHTVTALAAINAKPIIGTNTGNLYISQSSAWVQYKIPSFASDTIQWVFPVSDTKVWVGSSSKLVLWDLSLNAQIDILDPDAAIRDAHYDRRSGSLWILGSGFITRFDSTGELQAVTTKDIPDLTEVSSIGGGGTPDKIFISSPNVVIEIVGR